MSSCSKHPACDRDQNDPMIMTVTTSDSNEESGSSSSFSSAHHESPPRPTPQPCSRIKRSSFQLSVRNLTYTIDQNASSFKSFFPWHKPKPITILESISFVAKSGEMLAIVGPSGTGKSTLLRILSGSIKERDINQDSTIFINDQIVASPDQLRMACGYVAQDDDLLPLLTVKETLMFSAKFRLRKMDGKERHKRVQILIQELGLLHVANSFVGDEENRGISGGERKRVSIGVEMIHDPCVMLLDEPTSGLDSTLALQVIELLSKMAKSRNITVVLSIHQPSYRIMHHISSFLILYRGSVMHNGTLERLEENISRLGFQIPLQLNALDFAMEILACLGVYSSYQDSCDDEIGNSALVWSDVDMGEVESVAISMDQNHAYPYVSEINFLCSRFCKVVYRTKQLFLARVMQAIVGGIGLGSVFVNLRKDEAGVAERLGLFAFTLSFLLSSTVESLPIYLQERRVIMKEASRGAYRISSYMISHTIIFIPFLLIIALLFAIPVYWITGLNPSITAFVFFCLVVWLIVLMASSLVLFLSTISPDYISGNSLICLVLGAFFLFSGYFIPKESIPKYWMFMYYSSLYRYPLDSLVVNEYWSMRNECFVWQDRARSICLMNGNDVLMNRGLDEDNRWINVVIMLGFFLFYRVICWIVLVRKASNTII
ncbi:hypothetical protein Drorol1_Dr00001645 [Drosera rotundifolia]